MSAHQVVSLKPTWRQYKELRMPIVRAAVVASQSENNILTERAHLMSIGYSAKEANEAILKGMRIQL